MRTVILTIEFIVLVAFLYAFVQCIEAWPRSTSKAKYSAKKSSVGLRGYRRFHANDSFIGQPINCTYEEKICFKFNTLYNPNSKQCLPNSYSLCPYSGDRKQFLNGSGHLVATCPYYTDPCPGYRMAFDGRCYQKNIVRDVICGCDAEPTKHFLGGSECRCTPATPIRVRQPTKDGSCRIPDLRFPDHKRSYLHRGEVPLRTTPKVTLDCSWRQARCFSAGKVQVGGGFRCFRIFERGPCPEEHVVTLDVQNASVGRAEGVCTHVRGGCPPGEKRYIFNGRCSKDRDIDIIRVGIVYFTVYGQHLVVALGSDIEVILLAGSTPKLGLNNTCVVYHKASTTMGVMHYPHPHCGANDRGLCSLYEVEADAPMPIDD